MRRMTCDLCNCNKSDHKKREGRDMCMGCLQVYWDSPSVYAKERDNGHVGMYHAFRLNNLKWLEEQAFNAETV